MNSLQKFVWLQLIGLLVLGISVQAKPSPCPKNCVVRENAHGLYCDCSGIGGYSNIRIKRTACQRGCDGSSGKCVCNAGTYGVLQ